MTENEWIPPSATLPERQDRLTPTEYSPQQSTSFETLVIHAGESLEYQPFEPATTPIYASSSFSAESPEALNAIFAGERDGFVYSRNANPTTTAFERAIAALENAQFGRAFGSGMAALHAALLATEIRPGDSILAARDLYGTTRALLTTVFASMNVRVELCAMDDLERVESVTRNARPRLILIEAISNPLLRIADVPGLASIAHAHGARLIVDSTFATPCLCRPLSWGADLVVHSATKYLAGHGDATAGVVATNDPELDAALGLTQRLVGGVLSPFESYLALRGLKTLPLRFARQSETAFALARRLEQHPRVARVLYPGRESHPDYALACRLFGHDKIGGVLSFELRDGDQDRVFDFLRRIRLIRPATTLGDVYSLALYPAMSSHRALSREQRLAAGISDGLIRLSVGLEHLDDLVRDLDQALLPSAPHG
ncbi:MAG: PLP-dependent aspartate aminotransferase family protein [Chloroflexi bacterium]|nr:PLP-dependent aspartate aminotransferase family protein [Chloroflexota bacterium]